MKRRRCPVAPPCDYVRNEVQRTMSKFEAQVSARNVAEEIKAAREKIEQEAKAAELRRKPLEFLESVEVGDVIYRAGEIIYDPVSPGYRRTAEPDTEMRVEKVGFFDGTDGSTLVKVLGPDVESGEYREISGPPQQTVRLIERATQ